MATIKRPPIRGLAFGSSKVSIATEIDGMSAPVNTELPIISGFAQIGQSLQTTPGRWLGGVDGYAYQWYRSGSAIEGAISSFYLPIVNEDIGNVLSVSVIASNEKGDSIPAFSAPTGTVAPADVVIDTAPIIETPALIPGTPRVGIAITAIDAVWIHNVVEVFYQWKAAGALATGTGADTLTYIPVVGDIGKTLTITVITTNTGGQSLPSTSAASATTVDVIPVNSSVPIISDTTPQVGQILAASTGGWINTTTSFAYQWKSAGVNAAGPGSTSANYIVVSADLGNTLTVSVIATNSGGSSIAPAVSAATSAVTAPATSFGVGVVLGLAIAA